MITRAEKFISTHSVWSNAYGLGRSILAVSTFITLLFNPASILFITNSGTGIRCDPFGISIFCIIPNTQLACWVCIILLLPVIVGWRPMVTGIIHWYICYSVINSVTVIDGGDHIASIITLLLLPVTLTDTRKWHWQTITVINDSIPHKIRSIIAISCLVVIKIQVAVIYLNSAVAKLFVTEWKDGTAIYYWFKHPLFGYPAWLKGILDDIVMNGTIIFLITWGTIIFELILFAGLFMDKKHKITLMITGIIFHLSIVFIHGLGSFFFTMTGALILFLYPLGEKSLLPDLIKTNIYDRFINRRLRNADNRVNPEVLENRA